MNVMALLFLPLPTLPGPALGVVLRGLVGRAVKYYAFQVIQYLQRLKIVFCLFVSMPTHCTITRFGLRARRIDGIECGLFSNNTPLGQTTLHVRRVSVECTVES